MGRIHIFLSGQNVNLRNGISFGELWHGTKRQNRSTIQNYYPLSPLKPNKSCCRHVDARHKIERQQLDLVAQCIVYLDS